MVIERKIFINKKQNFLKMEFLVTGGFQVETKSSFIRYVAGKIHTWDTLDQRNQG